MALTEGTLYGPGLPPAGVPARGGFSAGRLRVERRADGVVLALSKPDAVPPPTSFDLPPERLELHPGGFDHDALFLRWTTPTHEHWAFAPAGPAGVQALLHDLPPRLAPMARRWRRRVATSRWKWTGLWGTLGMLVLAGVGLWWFFANVLDWAARRVPPEFEASLGKATVDDLRREGRLRTSGPMVALVEAIGKRLVPPGSPYTYHWYVKDDPDVNAFAAPGGYVVVHSGLIARAQSPDELAGVLAHEIQHVEHRHVTKGLIQSAGLGAVLLVTVGDASGLAAMVAHQMGTLSYSRGLETEADAEGVRDLARARIPPAALGTFFGRLLAEEKKKGGDSPEWLSSHPATPTRMAALAKLVAATPCRPACVSLATDARIPWAVAKAEAAQSGDGSDEEKKTSRQKSRSASPPASTPVLTPGSRL